MLFSSRQESGGEGLGAAVFPKAQAGAAGNVGAGKEQERVGCASEHQGRSGGRTGKETHTQKEGHENFPLADVVPAQAQPDAAAKIGEQPGEVGGAQDDSFVMGRQSVLEAAGKCREGDGLDGVFWQEKMGAQQ